MPVKFSSIIDLFCLIGCLYQIHGITKSFLQFKVRRDVAYDYSTYIELPAIDIMIPMVMGMNLTKLFAAYPEQMRSICAQMNTNDKELNYTIDNFREKCELNLLRSPIVVSRSLASFIKVKDIKKFSRDLRLGVNFLYYMTFGSMKQNCTLTRYYNGLAIFLRILCLNGTKPFSISTNSVAITRGIAGYIQFISRTYFGIRFSDPADLPAFEQGKYFIISNSKSGLNAMAEISYVKTVMSSLEYPYETNCRHYNKAKSISKCLTEYSLGQSTPYLLRTLIYEWNEHPANLGFDRDSKVDLRKDVEITDAEDEDGSELETQELNAISNCIQQKTDTECERVSYSVDGRVSGELFFYHEITFGASWKPNIYLSVYPVLPWSEYVIFVGSIVGIWLGISIHNIIFKILAGIISRILSKLKRQGNSAFNSTKISTKM